MCSSINWSYKSRRVCRTNPIFQPFMIGPWSVQNYLNHGRWFCSYYYCFVQCLYFVCIVCEWGCVCAFLVCIFCFVSFFQFVCLFFLSIFLYHYLMKAEAWNCYVTVYRHYYQILNFSYQFCLFKNCKNSHLFQTHTYTQKAIHKIVLTLM